VGAVTLYINFFYLRITDVDRGVSSNGNWVEQKVLDMGTNVPEN